jgi:AcrR family transcriptional regulator
MKVQKKTKKSSTRSWRTQVERRTDAEEALLTAAAELFSEQGIVNTSVAAICERAGYSHGLVNHHFGSKKALVERLTRRCQNDFISSLDQQHASSGREAILAIADSYLLTFSPSNTFARCFLVMWGEAFVSSRNDTFALADQRTRGDITRWVKEGKKDGSVAVSVDNKSFAAVLLAMVRGLAAQFMVSPDGLNVTKVRQECKDLIELRLRGTENLVNFQGD